MKQKLINRLVNDVGSRCPVGAIAGKLAVMLLVLTFVSCATDAPAPGMDTDVHCGEQQITRVYQHTYDEVFQACQEAIERLGWSITDKDSDKGTINGFGTINVFNAPAAEKSGAAWRQTRGQTMSCGAPPVPLPTRARTAAVV